MTSESHYVDLSHVVEDGLVTYKGLPATIVCDYLSREASRKHYAPGTEFHIGKIEMVANTGTYIDSPFHRFADGADLSQLRLENLVGLPGILVSIPESGGRIIDESWFKELDVRGKAVLVHTNWSRHWKTDQYFEDHPYLTAAAAAALRDGGAKLVGIDSYNIDSTDGGERPVHTILLGSEILIVEHMCNLASLIDHAFKFYAAPVKVKEFGTFPVRAFAELGVGS